MIAPEWRGDSGNRHRIEEQDLRRSEDWRATHGRGQFGTLLSRYVVRERGAVGKRPPVETEEVHLVAHELDQHLLQIIDG